MCLEITDLMTIKIAYTLTFCDDPSNDVLTHREFQGLKPYGDLLCPYQGPWRQQWRNGSKVPVCPMEHQ
jgi:hypothetical protein